MNRRPRILLADALDEVAQTRLAAAAEVVRARHADPAELADLIADCDALIVRTRTSVPRDVLEAGRRLRVVGVAGAGLDRVDLDAARTLGITVIDAAEAASDAVAEMTVALMLQLLRPIPRLAAAYRAGRYEQARAAPHGRELRDLTVGILGMGRIGSRVGRICASGFGARVLYNDIAEVGPFDFAATTVDKNRLYAESDILTLHVPLTDLTRGLIDAGVFARMRAGALLINTSRGAVVRTADMLDALRSGHITGAALDVTEPEPLPPDHPLFAMENVIVLPHVAARTVRGLRGMFDVVDAVLTFLRDRPE